MLTHKEINWSQYEEYYDIRTDTIRVAPWSRSTTAAPVSYKYNIADRVEVRDGTCYGKIYAGYVDWRSISSRTGRAQYGVVLDNGKTTAPTHKYWYAEESDIRRLPVPIPAPTYVQSPVPVPAVNSHGMVAVAGGEPFEVFSKGDMLRCNEYGEVFDAVYVGTFNEFGLLRHYAVRVDGLTGAAPDGGWLLSAQDSNCYYWRVDAPTPVAVVESEPHVMGLSEETIDRDAYDEYMRSNFR